MWGSESNQKIVRSWWEWITQQVRALGSRILFENYPEIAFSAAHVFLAGCVQAAAKSSQTKPKNIELWQELYAALRNTEVAALEWFPLEHARCLAFHGHYSADHQQLLKYCIQALTLNSQYQPLRSKFEAWLPRMPLQGQHSEHQEARTQWWAEVFLPKLIECDWQKNIRDTLKDQLFKELKLSEHNVNAWEPYWVWLQLHGDGSASTLVKNLFQQIEKTSQGELYDAFHAQEMFKILMPEAQYPAHDLQRSEDENAVNRRSWTDQQIVQRWKESEYFASFEWEFFSIVGYLRFGDWVAQALQEERKGRHAATLKELETKEKELQAVQSQYNAPHKMEQLREVKI